MEILVVAATSAEIAPLTTYLRGNWQEQNGTYTNGIHKVHLLVTGVGMVATSHALTKLLQHKRFDIAIQAGIAGSFDRKIPLGQVVCISQDCFADLGAEDHYGFIDVFELDLADGEAPPFTKKQLRAPKVPIAEGIRLPSVSGLSVNMVSGSSFTATSRHKKYGATAESMEGAAFHYVCLQEQIPFLQVRGISNYVEARDRSKWKLNEAVANLNNWLVDFLEEE